MSIDVEECFDVIWIADELASRGLAATFFLDVFASQGPAGASVVDAAKLLADHNLDVQLHTHAEHLGHHAGLSSLTTTEQAGLIRDGVGTLKEWTGRAPTWHRAGDLRADSHTLAACRDAGIIGDSSFIFGWPQCAGLGVDSLRRNDPIQLEGVLELPITTFLTVPLSGNYRQYDLDACTSAELTSIARQAVVLGQSFLVMLMHSTSFLRLERGKYVEDPVGREAMRLFLDSVATMDGLTVSDCRGINATTPSTAPQRNRGELCAGFALTYRRAWAHFDRSMKHKVVALAPFVVAGIMLALLAWYRLWP